MTKASGFAEAVAVFVQTFYIVPVRGEPPDGHRWTGHGTKMELVDPLWCPQGHPILAFRRASVPCPVHHRDYAWYCSCGETIYRDSGAFTDEPPLCLSEAGRVLPATGDIGVGDGQRSEGAPGARR